MNEQLVQFLLKQAGVDIQTGDLYGNMISKHCDSEGITSSCLVLALVTRCREYVYTQHQPLLFQKMESINKGRLRDIDYPLVGNHFQQGR